MRLDIRGLHDGQRLVLENPARHKILSAGRRWRKTTLGTVAALRASTQGKQGWWLAPTYSQSEVGWERLRDLTGPIPGTKLELSKRRIMFPGGGWIQAKSAANPDNLRAVGLDYAVLDEAAYCQERVWTEVVRPALIDRQGWSMFLSTPAGLNWFHRLYQTAENRSDWARWQFPTSSNPAIPASEIESAREDMPSIVFAQEIEAEFVESGTGRFKPEWFRYYGTLRVAGEHDHDRGKELWFSVGGDTVKLADLRPFITVDPAVSTKSSADYTVIAVCAWADDRLLVLDLLRARLEGPDILPTVRRMFDRWECSAVWIEAVAFQLTLVQQALRDGLPARRLKADRDKISRSIPLETLAEHGRLWFPKHAEWVSDLERELLAFPASEHDDQVDALAYAAAVGQRRSAGWAAS